VAVSETDIITEVAVILSSPQLQITSENIHDFVRAGPMSRYGPWNLVINKTVAGPLTEIEETELDFVDPETNLLKSVEVIIAETNRITGRTLVEESNRVARIARDSIARNKAMGERRFRIHYELPSLLAEWEAAEVDPALKQLMTQIKRACPAGFTVGKPGRVNNNHGQDSSKIYVHVTPTEAFAAAHPKEQEGSAAASIDVDGDASQTIEWSAIRRFIPRDSHGNPISTHWDGSVASDGRRYLKGVPNCCWSPDCDGVDCTARSEAVLNSTAGLRPTRQDNVQKWEKADKQRDLEQRRDAGKRALEEAQGDDDDGFGPTHDANGRPLCKKFRQGKCWRAWGTRTGCLRSHGGALADALQKDCASIRTARFEGDPEFEPITCGGTDALPCPYRHGPPLAHANAVLYTKGGMTIKAVVTGTTPQWRGEPTYVIAYENENGEAAYKEVLRTSLTLAPEGAGSSSSAPMET
jgi:hypothetical protein